MVRMSSLGLAQCCRGLSPGTESESSKVTASELPKREPAEAVARRADAMVRSFMVVVCLCRGVVQEREWRLRKLSQVYARVVP